MFRKIVDANAFAEFGKTIKVARSAINGLRKVADKADGFVNYYWGDYRYDSDKNADDDNVRKGSWGGATSAWNKVGKFFDEWRNGDGQKNRSANDNEGG